jgi:very-short-patch-repair endonuclease
MKVVETLLNRSELVAYREIKKIADDNGLFVFAKTRLSDVIDKGKTILTQREFNFFTRSHCDFVITTEKFNPIMIVEYDGPAHDDPVQMERDSIKNEICRRAGLGMLRIHDRHVTKLYRGMTVLRWIIEVSELEKAFTEAQENGHIPLDEPFDPAFAVGTDNRRFPYWLSQPASIAIHRFFESLDRSLPRGWNSFIGRDAENTWHRLSSLSFGDKVLWAKTGVRTQDVDFPQHDLANELDTCELGIRLEKFQKGEIRAYTNEEFRPIFKSFCERYDVNPSHSYGSFPFEIGWNFKDGWVGR